MGRSAVAGTTTDARKTSGATGHAARTGELTAGATADTRDAAGAARTATGTAVLATGTAVAVGITAAATRVVLEDHVSRCGGRVGGGDRACDGERCSGKSGRRSPGHDQSFQGG